jgi:uncharacterized protein (TIGR03086 family)
VHHDELFNAATDAFGARLESTGGDQWSAATPNDEWDVRALVNHVAGEVLWVPPLLAGSTIADVGDRLDGDLLGDDPAAVWIAGLAEARRAAADADPDAIVHLSYGDVKAGQYLFEVGADVLVHTWDLARATGGNESLPPALVEQVATWFAGVEDLWRGAGVIGPRVDVGEGADAQTTLLAGFGRDAR